jgi:hypothetical protein
MAKIKLMNKKQEEEALDGHGPTIITDSKMVKLPK